jgi:hypothetical protein
LILPFHIRRVRNHCGDGENQFENEGRLGPASRANVRTWHIADEARELITEAFKFRNAAGELCAAQVTARFVLTIVVQLSG